MIETLRDGYRITTPYNKSWLYNFKRLVPAIHRSWNSDAKYWEVTPHFGREAIEITSQYFNIAQEPASISIPDIKTYDVKMKYIGIPKDREGSDQAYSFGYAGGWNLVFPESVLREWFGVRDLGDTLYSILGIPESATPDQIKAGWLRMVKQWHPDVCKEPDAHDVFIKVQDAYNKLSDPLIRQKYDAGLQFASLDKYTSKIPTSTFRPPLRSGKLTVRATQMISRLYIEEILSWEDITNSQGQTLVTWINDDFTVGQKWA